MLRMSFALTASASGLQSTGDGRRRCSAAICASKRQPMLALASGTPLRIPGTGHNGPACHSRQDTRAHAAGCRSQMANRVNYGLQMQSTHPAISDLLRISFVRGSPFNVRQLLDHLQTGSVHWELEMTQEARQKYGRQFNFQCHLHRPL